MEVQETNIDLSDFRVPKMYIKGEWREFPDYRINRDGTKVYSLKTNKYISITLNKYKSIKQVKLVDACDSKYCCSINTLIWFTFEYDNLDLSECKSIYYNYKYYPRYLINSNGTIVFDTKTKKIISQVIRFYPKYEKDSKATSYYSVSLYLDSKCKKTVYVHQLVKWTYKGGPEIELKPPIIRPTVDHIDRNGLNNNIDNLRWVENSLNASMGVSGSKHGNAVIDENIARQICVELQQEDLSISYIAKEFNVSYEVIHKIYRGYNWKGISMKYMPFPERVKTMKKKVGN